VRKRQGRVKRMSGKASLDGSDRRFTIPHESRVPVNTHTILEPFVLPVSESNGTFPGDFYDSENVYVN
jgi:hypothetical protein